MKNKKGNLPIVLLVFLVLLIVVVSLFIFNTRIKKVREEIYYGGFINNINSKKNLAEFYIYNAVINSLIESYEEMTFHGKFVENPSFDTELNPHFGIISTTLDGDFNEIFNEKFKKNFNNYLFTEDYLNDLKTIIHDGGFNYNFDGETLELNISDFNIKESSEKINFSSFFVLSIDVGLKKIGLDNFHKIYDVKENCKKKETSESIQKCFEEGLSNFDIGINERISSGGKKSFIVNLRSKKLFLINGEFKHIKFSFIPI